MSTKCQFCEKMFKTAATLARHAAKCEPASTAGQQNTELREMINLQNTRIEKLEQLVSALNTRIEVFRPGVTAAREVSPLGEAPGAPGMAKTQLPGVGPGGFAHFCEAHEFLLHGDPGIPAKLAEKFGPEMVVPLFEYVYLNPAHPESGVILAVDKQRVFFFTTEWKIGTTEYTIGIIFDFWVPIIEAALSAPATIKRWGNLYRKFRDDYNHGSEGAIYIDELIELFTRDSWKMWKTTKKDSSLSKLMSPAIAARFDTILAANSAGK